MFTLSSEKALPRMKQCNFTATIQNLFAPKRVGRGDKIKKKRELFNNFELLMTKKNLDITIDEYYEIREKNKKVIFIVLKEDEYGFLSEHGKHWLHHFYVPVYVLRLKEQDFVLLEIGVHPKVIVTHGYDDIAEFNGLPHIQEIEKILRSKVCQKNQQ